MDDDIRELTEEDIEFIMEVEQVIEAIKTGKIEGEYLEF